MIFCSLAITKIQLFIEKLLFLPFYLGVGNFSKYYNKIYAEKNEENIVNNIKDMKRVFEKEGTFDVNAINAKKAIIARMVDEWPYLKTKNIVVLISAIA